MNEIMRRAGVDERQEFLVTDAHAETDCVSSLDACYGIQGDTRFIIFGRVVSDHVFQRRVLVLDEEEASAAMSVHKLVIAVKAKHLTTPFRHLGRREAPNLSWWCRFRSLVDAGLGRLASRSSGCCERAGRAETAGACARHPCLIGPGEVAGMFQITRALELHVNPDVVTEATCEHLLFLAIYNRVGATQEREKLTLVVCNRAGLTQKPKLAQRVASDRRAKASVTEGVELLP